MFFDKEDDKYSQQGQKAGDFPDRLNDTNAVTVQAGNLHRKIVKQGDPGLQTNSGCYGQYRQEQVHGIFLDLIDLQRGWLMWRCHLRLNLSIFLWTCLIIAFTLVNEFDHRYLRWS